MFQIDINMSTFKVFANNQPQIKALTIKTAFCQK